MIKAGQQARDFTLPDQDGNPTTLTAYRGEPVVLYFYPKADTPGCTTQACGIRDHRADYERSGATVLGVSPDPVAAIRKFADKYGLDFTLLADADHDVAELYGTWVEKRMYGRTYMGVQRARRLRSTARTTAAATSSAVIWGSARGRAWPSSIAVST